MTQSDGGSDSTTVCTKTARCVSACACDPDPHNINEPLMKYYSVILHSHRSDLVPSATAGTFLLSVLLLSGFVYSS